MTQLGLRWLQVQNPLLAALKVVIYFADGKVAPVWYDQDKEVDFVVENYEDDAEDEDGNENEDETG